MSQTPEPSVETRAFSFIYLFIFYLFIYLFIYLSFIYLIFYLFIYFIYLFIFLQNLRNIKMFTENIALWLYRVQILTWDGSLFSALSTQYFWLTRFLDEGISED